MPIPRPEPDQYPDYQKAYVDLVPDGPILETLAAQIEGTAGLLWAAGEERGDHRYAPGKWTVKEVVCHLVDTERVFAYRALRFARGDQAELPGFEQDDWVAVAGCERRRLADLVEELRLARAASLSLFAGFPEDAWRRRGKASGYDNVVGAYPWILAGHELHHVAVLHERYGL